MKRISGPLALALALAAAGLGTLTAMAQTAGGPPATDTTTATQATQQPAPPATRPNSSEGEDANNPTITIEGFTAQVTRAGVPRQVITGNWARMDEKENVLDLRQLQARLFDNGKQVGQADAGSGRVWMKARPEEQVGAQDVRFADGVLYRMQKGWLLSTPAMHFSNKQRRVTGDAGYIKQTQIKDGYLVGRGQKFEIGINMENNSFESWREYGKPAVLEKSKKPEIKP